VPQERIAVCGSMREAVEQAQVSQRPTLVTGSFVTVEQAQAVLER